MTEVEAVSPQERFNPLFYPRSVAVVGASARPEKLGNFALRSAVSSGVEKVYPIHAGGAPEILGKPALRRIEDLPEQVDLFLFAIPQGHILSAFQTAVDKGCRAAVIFSGGFKEIGAEGEKQEDELRRMADEARVAIIGPNTIGYMRSDSRLNATFMPGLSDLFCNGPGIAVISQSGGSLGLITYELIDSGLPVGTLVGLGNRANTEFADLLDYVKDDPLTSGVLLFIEGIEDVRRFCRAASRCAREKPVVAMSSGHTEAGRKVALSHTGSMASSEKIYQAVLAQAGVLQVQSVQEMVDAIKVLTACPPLSGRRAAVITHTAGPAIIATDVLARGGFQLPPPSRTTREKLLNSGALPGFMPVTNPLDMVALGWTEPRRYLQVLEPLLQDDGIDAVLSIYTTGLGDVETSSFPVEDFAELARVTGDKTGKAVVSVWGAPVTRTGDFERWQKGGFPVYPTPERAGTALVNLANYSALRQKAETRVKIAPAVFDPGVERIIREAVSKRRSVIQEPEATELLESAGIRVAKTRLAVNTEEAVALAAEIGYPVALKVVSEKILHKSDAGGVKLNLKNEGEVRKAFLDIQNGALTRISPPELRGIAVQAMIPEGTEVIVGGICDEQAGPVVMFGLGGIWVEVFRDTVFRLAPLSPKEAEEMIRSVKGYSILQGVRGKKGIEPEYLTELIVKMGELMSRYPLQEIDLNPVIFYESGYAAADVRIILDVKT
jgi:acetyltransferase